MVYVGCQCTNTNTEVSQECCRSDHRSCLIHECHDDPAAHCSILSTAATTRMPVRELCSPSTISQGVLRYIQLFGLHRSRRHPWELSLIVCSHSSKMRQLSMELNAHTTPVVHNMQTQVNPRFGEQKPYRTSRCCVWLTHMVCAKTTHIIQQSSCVVSSF